MIVRVAAALVALILFIHPGVGNASTLEEMRGACRIGSDPTPDGSMPTSVSGVVIVSPREAKCVLDQFKDVVLIAPQRDIQQIPGSRPIISLAAPPDSRESETKFTPAVTRLTGGDLSRPVMVYCHHTSCQYSYNAALNLKRLGYTRILWLREGLKGWETAKYPLAKLGEVNPPLDEPAYLMWFMASSNFTFSCFGEKKADACAIKLALLARAASDSALPAKDSGTVFSEYFNTGAVSAENLRESGKVREGYDLVKALYGDLMNYAGGGTKLGVLSGNAKVLREYALASFEVGRPSDAQQFLAAARKDGGARFKQLAAAPAGSDQRKDIQGAMVAMEHMERDVADYAAKKAADLYDEGKKADAAVYRTLADAAADHAILWIQRNAKEGIGSMMDLEPQYRIAEIKLLQGKLARQAADIETARKAFIIGGNAICSLVSDADFKTVADGGSVKDIRADLFAHKCYELQASYYVVSPEFAKWSAEQAKREYDFYLSLLKD